MSILNAFNQLASIGQNAAQTVFNQLGAEVRSTAQIASNRNNDIGYRNQGQLSLDPTRLASQNRMLQNLSQGVGAGANTLLRQGVSAIFTSTSGGGGWQDPDAASTRNAASGTGGQNSNAASWRVRLSVPNTIRDAPTLSSFSQTNNEVVFPFTPSILFGNSANYSQIQPIHTNYPYNAYQNSQVDAITIIGEYYNEYATDGVYYLSVVHYLRTMTKMFYGESSPKGNPPLLCRLNGYGPHVLSNIPVLIQGFTMDLPSDVDYIPVNFMGQTNYVPTQTTMTVTCMPQYSRRAQSKFSLNTFANGGYASTGEGFI